MRSSRREAGTTTNKDLDTGGYNAQTREAERTWPKPRSTELSAKRSRHKRDLGMIRCPLGKLLDGPSRQGGVFNSLPNRTQTAAGWVGLPPCPAEQGASTGSRKKRTGKTHM
jgi:hypothetical protein